MNNLKKVLALLIVLGAVFSTTNITSAKTKLDLPENAVEVSEGVFKLGKSHDKHLKMDVDGIAIVHKKGNAKGLDLQARFPKAPTCYAPMAAGAKWKTVEPWEVYGGAGLTNSFVLNTINSSINTWETAAVNKNILGAGSAGVGAIIDPYTLDNLNQVSFGDLDSGTIAVTVVWGNWSGPVNTRQIVAWDQIYNTDFAWTTNAVTEPAKMDFWNIAMHELGHSMGLADMYQSGCSAVTMYGYATEGQTSKRTLEKADKDGINTLY